MLIANNSKLAKAPAIALALSLGLVLSGCGGMPTTTTPRRSSSTWSVIARCGSG